MIGWLWRTKRQPITTREAQQAVNTVRQEKPAVDELVEELRTRRQLNKFAPGFEAALGVRKREVQ